MFIDKTAVHAARELESTSQLEFPMMAGNVGMGQSFEKAELEECREQWRRPGQQKQRQHTRALLRRTYMWLSAETRDFKNSERGAGWSGQIITAMKDRRSAHFLLLSSARVGRPSKKASWNAAKTGRQGARHDPLTEAKSTQQRRCPAYQFKRPPIDPPESLRSQSTSPPSRAQSETAIVRRSLNIRLPSLFTARVSVLGWPQPNKQHRVSTPSRCSTGESQNFSDSVTAFLFISLAPHRSLAPCPKK